jgi:hypothetical protein
LLATDWADGVQNPAGVGIIIFVTTSILALEADSSAIGTFAPKINLPEWEVRQYVRCYTPS